MNVDMTDSAEDAPGLGRSKGQGDCRSKLGIDSLVPWYHRQSVVGT